MLRSIRKTVAAHILRGQPIFVHFNLRGGTTEEFDRQLNRWALRTSFALPDFELERLRQQKLSWILREASRIPFWDRRIGIDDFSLQAILTRFSSIPLVSRRELADIPLDERSNAVLANHFRAVVGRTSGSTGIPLMFYRSPRSKVRSQGIYWQFLQQVAGLVGRHGEELRVLNLGMQRLIAIYPWSGFTPGLSLENQTSRKKIFEYFKRLQPDILFTNPSYIKRLRYWFENDNVFFPFRAIVYTAQRLNDIERRFLIRFFNCPIYSIYAAQEVSVMGTECFHQSGKFHIVPELSLLEILRRDGAPVTPGESGEVVCTYFDNPISPFIRYRVGDIGRIERVASCPCGRTTDLLTIDGRPTEFVDLPNGNSILCKMLHITIDEAMADKVYQYQLEQRGNRELIIRVVPRDVFSPVDAARLIKIIRPMLQYQMKVSIETCSFISPRGEKTPLFITTDK